MLRKLLPVLICTSLVLLTVTGCNSDTGSGNNTYTGMIQTARTAIQQELLAGSSCNATVAVMDNDKIVYSEGFGMRDIANSIPVDTNTQFNIGSVSKTFAAASVMLLLDQGKIKLDDPITTYLPEFKMQDSRYKDITIRMLLNHTCAFPGSNDKNTYTSNKDQNFINETLSLLSRSNLKSNPGEASVYCNAGFTLLFPIIEKASGLSLSDFLDKNIFSKLDMKNTSAYFKDNNPNIATSFDNSNGIPKPKEYVNALTSGGLSSTAEDLCKFGSAFYSDSKFLQSKTLQEFLKPQYGPKTVPEGTPNLQYGFGWDTVAIDEFNQQNVTVLMKSGGTTQYFSFLYVAPKEKLSVALIFSGGDGLTVESITTKIMQKLLEGKGIVKKLEDKKTLPLKTVPIPKDLLSYKGYYGAQNNIIKIDFDTQNNTVNMYKFNNGTFTSTGTFPYKEDGYFYKSNGDRYKFSSNYNTKFIMLYPSGSSKGDTYSEGLKIDTTTLQSSNFDNKFWVPLNLDLYDLSFPTVLRSATTNELPNYILYGSGDAYLPGKLVDKNTANMSLQFIRDIHELKIEDNNGVKVLMMGNYKFIDTTKLDTLKANVKVIISQSGYNESRIVDKDTVFKCTIGDKDRIVVAASDGSTSYDSLLNYGSKEILINKGSYITFIGNPGDTFEPVITQ